MGIRSLSTASISTGTKRSKVWDQSAVIVTNSYESIATTTVGAGGAAYIEFTSIPQTYKHLQIRSTNSAASATWTVLTLNGDTSISNYAQHRLGADGATPFAGASYSSSSGANYCFTSYPHIGGSIIDILEYTNTSINKNIRGFHGHRGSASTTEGEINIMSNLWMNTAAITSIKISIPSTTFNQHSTFALYGIKG